MLLELEQIREFKDHSLIASVLFSTGSEPWVGVCAKAAEAEVLLQSRSWGRAHADLFDLRYTFCVFHCE